MNEGKKHDYSGFSLKKDLVKAIEEQVINDPTYTSVTEFIRVSIREKLERLHGAGY